MTKPPSKPQQPKTTGITAANEGIPEEVVEMIDNLPQEHRDTMRSVISTTFACMTRTSPEGEIARKITSEHIGAMIDAQKQAMQYSHEDNSKAQRNRLIYAGMGCAFVLLIILLLKDQPTIMLDVLKIGGSAIIGLLGGYGIGVNKASNRSND